MQRAPIGRSSFTGKDLLGAGPQRVIGIVNALSRGVIDPEKLEERRERHNQPGIRRTSK